MGPQKLRGISEVGCHEGEPTVIKSIVGGIRILVKTKKSSAWAQSVQDGLAVSAAPKCGVHPVAVLGLHIAVEVERFE
jgi:hypothetical protein